MNTAGVERAKHTYKNSSNINNGKFAKCHTLQKALHIYSEQYDRMQTGKDDKIHQSDNERNSDKHKAVGKGQQHKELPLTQNKPWGGCKLPVTRLCWETGRKQKFSHLRFFLLTCRR